MQKFQVGDKVVLVTGYFHHGALLTEHAQAAPQLTVVRQMLETGDEYEVSDGTIRRGSELHLVERAPSGAPTSPDAA